MRQLPAGQELELAVHAREQRLDGVGITIVGASDKRVDRLVHRRASLNLRPSRV